MIFKEQFHLPVYIKVVCLLIAGYGFTYLFYIGQDIFIPLIFSALFAVLLNPAVKYLIHHGLHRIVAIGLVILIASLLICGLIYFMWTQLSMFTERIPELKTKLSALLEEGSAWLSSRSGVEKKQIDEYITLSEKEFTAGSGSFIGNTLSTITGTLILIVLIPIYVFMMLYYEPLFTEFTKRVFPKEKHGAVGEIVAESKSAMQHYLGGLLVETGIIAVMNSVGLLIIGVDYAILWGILGGLLNIIPYIGGAVAVALPMLMALLTQDESAVIMVLVLYTAVQFIDNNFIVPAVVASRVKINALVSVIVVLIGGALWGVPGMFLSIPVIGVVKIVFDRIAPLKPYGYLLGDSLPEEDDSFFSLAEIRKKFGRRKEGIAQIVKDDIVQQ